MGRKLFPEDGSVATAEVKKPCNIFPSNCASSNNSTDIHINDASSKDPITPRSVTVGCLSPWLMERRQAH
ncbi:hypothetical protein ACOMHN_014717 [Nucella lapillus]